MNSPSEKIAITVNTLLYIIQKSGGICDFHKVFKILYFADQKHLSRYGCAITDDTYIAMANGPVPSMAYDILKSLRGEGLFTSQKDQFTPYFELQINKHTVTAKKSPDLDYLSESEMRCIDESIEENYHLKFSDLTEKSHDTALQNAVSNGEIDLLDVATCGGAGNDMIEYIKESSENRLAVFEQV